jgi:hypothetical protein
MHAHEEQLRLRIAKLCGIDNVAAMFGQKAGNAVNDAALVVARQGEDVFRVRHIRFYVGKKPGGARQRRLLSHDLKWISPIKQNPDTQGVIREHSAAVQVRKTRV